MILGLKYISVVSAAPYWRTSRLTTGHLGVRVLPQVSVQHRVADLVANLI